jgi:hypothetical protein
MCRVLCEEKKGFGLQDAGRKKPQAASHLKKENPPFIPN